MQHQNSNNINQTTNNLPFMKNSKKKNSRRSTVAISRLVNSTYYFIECVFIMHLNTGYRLVVIHNGYLLKDSTYDTLKGSRIAFSKEFGHKAWQNDVTPVWTPFYNPDTAWLKEKVD
jgi:hypothetical protein